MRTSMLASSPGRKASMTTEPAVAMALRAKASGLVPVLGDEHTFATGKAVLLDDPRCTGKAVKRIIERPCPPNDDVFSRGDAGGFHGSFGEGLRPFQGGVRSHWTEACSPSSASAKPSHRGASGPTTTR